MSDPKVHLGTNACPTYPSRLATVTPSDDGRFEPSVVWTTDGGNINVVTHNGDTVLVESVPAGGEIKCLCIGVKSASTAATKIYRSW